MNAQLKEIAKVWPDIQNIFSAPHNEKDYKKLVSLLDSIIDGDAWEYNGNIGKPEDYGDKGNPVDTLKALMEEHGIRQSDMPEIGSQGVVSEILPGKR